MKIFKQTLVILTGLVGLIPAAFAQSGTWTNLQSSVWSEATNWLNGIIATNAGNTAIFSANLSTNDPNNVTVTVSLDPVVDPAGRTIGNLTFTDTDTATPGSLGNWSISDGGIGLILDDTTQPNVIVTVNTATGSGNNMVTGWENTTVAANLTTTNTLVKAGAGHLILNPPTANTMSGGMIISNGMVQLGVANQAGTANTAAPGSGLITFRGGSLRLQNAAIPGNNPGNGGGGIPGLALPVLVETGQTGTIFLPPRAFPAMSSVVSGGGTLTLFVDFVRDDLAGDWSSFTGLVRVASSTRQAGDLRFTTAFATAGGWANSRVLLTTNGVNANTITMYNNGASGGIIPFGELSATAANIVNIIANNTGGGAGNSLPFVMRVGGLNTDASFSGNFAAPGAANGVGVIKEGTGTWIMNGATIENNGIMVVSNGVLQIGSGTSGKLGRMAVVSNYSALAFGRTDTALVVTNIIDGPGVLIQRGTGRTTLLPTGGSNNTYTGKTFVTNGTLAVASQTALGALPGGFVADQLTLNGGSLAATTTTSINDVNRGITLGANGGGLGADGANTLTVVNVIGGSGNLTINNTGTVSSTGAHSYTGKTILQAGTLLLASENLGPAPGGATADQLTFNGGTLRSSATFAIDDANRGLTINSGGATFSPDAATTLTISRPVAGSGVLTKTNAGTLVLNGVNTHSGSTLIAQGTLAIGASGSSVSSSISVSLGATFDVSATAFTLGSGRTLTGNGAVAGNFTAGSGSVVAPGTSVGALSFANNLTLNGNTVNVEISSSTNDVINVTGDLSLSGVSTINLTLLSVLPAGTYQLIKYGGTLASGSVANLTLAGYPVFRTTAVLVHNVGTKSIDLVLTGSPASLVWQGGLNGNAWDAVLTTNWLNSGNPDVFFNGDGATFNDVGAANSTVNLAGSLLPTTATVNSATDYTFSGAGKLSGLSTLVKAGANKLTVLTTNDTTGSVTISSGTVQVGNGTASGSLGTGNVTDNAALAFNVPGSLTVANQISGSGSLTVNAGTVVLTGNNSYGATVIDGGTTLQVGNNGATGSVGSGAVTDNGALVYRRTGTVTNLGPISGSGSLTVQSNGTVVLAANNSYAGPTTVDIGTLQVGAGGTAGSLGSAATVTLTSAGRIAFNRSDVLTNAVTVLGTSGTLGQFGTGTLVITNDANNFGPTLITAGKLQLGDGVNASGQLGRGTITVTSPGSLVFNRPDVYTLTNLVAGNGSLAHIGPTNLNITTIAGANTYSGGTTLSNSTVILVAATTSPADAGFQSVNGGAFGTGPLTFLGSSTVQLAAADATDPFGNGTGNFGVPVNVPAGQTGTLWLPGRFEMSSAVSGAGTVNLGVNYVRGNISGNWTNLTGTLNVVANTVNTNNVAHDFRCFNTIGFPNARVNLSNNVSMFWRGTANSVVPMGALSGHETAFFGGTGGAEGGNAVTWRVGGLNTDSTYEGTSGGSVAIGILKVGTGKLTFTGANNYAGNTTVSNGVLVLATNSVGANAELQFSPMVTLVAPAALHVWQRTDATFNLGIAAVQTNAGNGTIVGNLAVHPSGTVAPGFSIGTLTVSSNLAFVAGGNYNVEINRAGLASDRIVAQNVDLSGVTIAVNNIGTLGITNGSTFQIFQASGVISGTPASVSGGLPPGPGSGWNTANLTVNGTITAMTPPAPVLTNGVTGTTLDFAWDPAYLGWRLYVQTNALSIGLSTNWLPIAGTEAVTTHQETINPTVGTVFYRLSYP